MDFNEPEQTDNLNDSESIVKSLRPLIIIFSIFIVLLFVFLLLILIFWIFNGILSFSNIGFGSNLFGWNIKFGDLRDKYIGSWANSIFRPGLTQTSAGQRETTFDVNDLNPAKGVSLYDNTYQRNIDDKLKCGYFNQ